jgi:hypothetical protein
VENPIFPQKVLEKGIGMASENNGMANNLVVECAESLCPQREGIE